MTLQEGVILPVSYKDGVYNPVESDFVWSFVGAVSLLLRNRQRFATALRAL